MTLKNWRYFRRKGLNLLCTLVDELVRGDVNLMRREVSKSQFLANGSIILFSLMYFMAGLAIISRVSGAFKSIAIITTGVLAILTLFYCFKAERMKKKANIRTYGDILDYFNEEEN